MNGSEAIVDLVSAGLTARAIEPTAGESSGHSHESACLNCGTALVGSHCHACGQAAHVHKTLGAFFHDLLHGVFHFEGKIWRTLPLLAWDPGRLTREYIDGRRASYVSPIALFLFVVFLTFAVVHAIGEPVKFNDGDGIKAPKGMTEASAKIDAEIAALEKQRAAAVAAHQPTDAIDEELAGDRAVRDAMHGVAPKQLPNLTNASADKTGGPLLAALGERWKKVKQNPDLAFYKLQSSAYKYSWLLIPLSLPFVWLLFPFSRRFGLYDHTVFITYSLSFMFLLLTAVSAAVKWSPNGPLKALMLYAPFHMYRQLRGTYELSAFSAVWRTMMLVSFASIVLGFWALALLGMLMAE